VKRLYKKKKKKKIVLFVTPYQDRGESLSRDLQARLDPSWRSLPPAGIDELVKIAVLPPHPAKGKLGVHDTIISALNSVLPPAQYGDAD
jgi:hypothetical protein